MTLEQAQQSVDGWIKTNGVRYFNELTNMAMLTEEVGEVARIIARRYGEQSEKESDKDKDLGDTQISLVTSQYNKLKADHDKVRNLRDATVKV